jgi:hypothetical protein
MSEEKFTRSEQLTVIMAEKEIQLVLLLFKLKRLQTEQEWAKLYDRRHNIAGVLQYMVTAGLLQPQNRDRFALTEEGTNLVANVLVRRAKTGKYLIYWPSDWAETL